MRILALKWRRLGDTVLWTSALAALRDLYYDAAIDVALPAPYLPLFDADPRFGRKFALQRGSRAAFRLAREWRRGRYDLVLNFHASHRTLLMTLAAGAREKILHHHRRRPRRFFSDRLVPHLGEPMAANERDLNVVRALGWNGPTPAPRLFVSDRIKDEGRSRLVTRGWDPSRKLVLLSHGASRPAKRWGIERYAELARLLKDVAPSPQVGLVSDSDAWMTESPAAREAIERHALLIPTPELPHLLGCLPHASVLVGSDSGVKHVAAALGVPTVTLFGPESLGEWHFYPAPHKVLQREVLCRTNDAGTAFAWCGEHRCPLSSHACMGLITPEDVATVVRTALAESLLNR